MPKIVDREEQRREIAAQAARWIARRGLETLSLRNIATAHGCSKGMVQHYFSDKEELLFGALLHVTAEYEQRALQATAGLGGLQRIERRFAVILPLNQALREEWVVRLAFYARAALVPAMQEYLHQHVLQALRDGIREMREARKSGEVRAGLNLSRAYRNIMATATGIAVSEVVSPGSVAPATQKRMLSEAVGGLRNADGAGMSG
jgi:TetR/AcrR family transcriptional regulator, transcriptional repressor of bet genes